MHGLPLLMDERDGNFKHAIFWNGFNTVLYVFMDCERKSFLSIPLYLQYTYMHIYYRTYIALFNPYGPHDLQT